MDESQPLLSGSITNTREGDQVAETTTPPSLLHSNERSRIIDYTTVQQALHHPHQKHSQQHSHSYPLHQYHSCSPPTSDSDGVSPSFNRLKKKTWSFHSASGTKSHSNLENNSHDNNDYNSHHRISRSDDFSSPIGLLSSPDVGGQHQFDNKSLLHRVSDYVDSKKSNRRSTDQQQRLFQQQSDDYSIDQQRSVYPLKISPSATSNRSTYVKASEFLYYVIYAIVNVIISVPSLYGYAAVIFSHECYQPHMNALSKLVIASSAVHQLSFCLFSSLPFAIGTVQDAGLIFLSSMSTTIANRIINDMDGTAEEVISTAMVLLSLGTAVLGLVLMILGYFRMADAVSYLPMPVVGGYLAFIGYFCLMAGVALCISKEMMEFSDWAYLLDPQCLLLVVPGLISGLLFTLISRYVKNDAALPLSMVAIPALFYFILWVFDISMEEARGAGWVGVVAPSVPAKDLLSLVDFSLVQWNLIADIFPTWVGMVFVVSFASCLDVAAISMDMGEALDTNKELATVGIGNFMSGLTFGYTGSYIFSQTIFTYRTGVHSRWIGAFIIIVFGYVVASPVNVLQLSPLFFFGSTLIFIGFDLLYEWLFEIRERIFLSEYIIVWGTFIAIQFVGMDIGILIGVLFSIVDHVVHTAKTTGVYRVNKRSRAQRTPEESKILQGHGYNQESPKIVCMEVVGSVFFGSSLFILQRILDEIGIDLKSDDHVRSVDEKLHVSSPRTPKYFMSKENLLPGKSKSQRNKKLVAKRIPAKFVVLDLSRVTNLDASAARGCFLQLAKIAQKYGIIVAACGQSVRIEWMLRSHDVAYDIDEEEHIKEQFVKRDESAKSERLLLFVTVHEALYFCEQTLISQMSRMSKSVSDIFLHRLLHGERQTLVDVFARALGSSGEELNIIKALDGERYHSEMKYEPGDAIFLKGSHPDGFYVVLHGAVAVAIDNDDPRHQEYRSNSSIVSGAGLVQQQKASSRFMEASVRDDDEIVVASVWPVGGLFGYVDFLLDRPRKFTAVATHEGTVVAKMTMAQIRLIQNENPSLDSCLQRVFLKASLLDLANCTCDE